MGTTGKIQPSSVESQLDDIVGSVDEVVQRERPTPQKEEDLEGLVEIVEPEGQDRPPANDAEIYLRFADILPRDIMKTLSVTLVGAGGIGRPLGMILGSMGFMGVRVFDPDRITQMNVGSQGYSFQDVGSLKVEVLADEIEDISPFTLGWPYEYKYPPDPTTCLQWAADPGGGPLMCCVDDIVARKDVWEGTIPQDAEIFIDGRMGAENGRVITVLMEDEADRKYYESTLFPAEEQEELPCTSKATIYCGNYIASIMAAQLSRWVRGLIKPGDKYRDLLFSLRTFDMIPYTEGQKIEPTSSVKKNLSTGSKQKQAGAKKTTQKGGGARMKS